MRVKSLSLKTLFLCCALMWNEWFFCKIGRQSFWWWQHVAFFKMLNQPLFFAITWKDLQLNKLLYGKIVVALVIISLKLYYQMFESLNHNEQAENKQEKNLKFTRLTRLSISYKRSDNDQVPEKLRVKTSLKLKCKKAFRLRNFFLVKLNFLHILELIYRRMYYDLQ